MEELKPCPFCGSEAKKVLEYGGGIGRCKDCFYCQIITKPGTLLELHCELAITFPSENDFCSLWLPRVKEQNHE